MSENSNSVYEFGPFRLDPLQELLLDGTRKVPLTPKAYQTLLVMVENHGRIVTKDELLQKVWPDAYVEEATLAQNVFTLRKQLCDDREGTLYIETIPKRGYRFVAEVRQVDTAAIAPVSAPTTGGDRTPELDPHKSVAVLYFENLSGEKEDEYFRDGMTEDVITELAKIKVLRLFPRSAVLAFRDKPLPVTEVGQQLRAAFVLEGSVRRARQPSSHHRPAR